MSTRLTEAELVRLENLEAKATPGEWKVSESGVYIDAADGMVAEMESCPEFKSNSEFIAALRNHAPALIAAARRAAVLERLVDPVRMASDRLAADYRNRDGEWGFWPAENIHGQLVQALDELAALDAAGKEVQRAE